MEFLSILLGGLAIVAVTAAALTTLMAAAARDPEYLLFTLVCVIFAAGMGLCSTLADKAHQTTWKDSSAVVRTVFNEGEDVMLLSKYGTVYRCVEQAECQDLEKGDHVTFEWLPGGSSVPDTPDARNVVKG
jgi:hypothetical protein